MKQKVPEQLKERLATLPKAPGCYLMKDRAGQIFYIGKATRLNERVRSYFSGQDQRAFVTWLSDILYDLEVIVVNSPEEALILERTLIQQHRPKYNIRLKDDANYIHLRLKQSADTPTAKRSARYPRFEFVRQPRADKASYFGPFTSARVTRQTVQLLEKHFQIRSCRDHELENRVRPCLKYEIQQCSGPCIHDVDGYTDQLKHAVLLLEKKPQELLVQLRSKMWTAAENERYEKAARLRDQIQTIETHFSTNHATDIKSRSLIDVIAVKEVLDHLYMSRLTFRHGRLTSSHRYTFERSAFDFTEQCGEAILEIYRPLIEDWPTKIYSDIEWHPDTQYYLNQLNPRRLKLDFSHPQRGAGRQLLRLAKQHIESLEEHQQQKISEREKSLQAVQKRLRLEQYPTLIECYDISTFQGTSTVASGITFKNGLPFKKGYKSYRISPQHAGNDFDSLYEALYRRFKRGLEENDFPELILIDGGAQQLAAVLQAADDIGFDYAQKGVDIRAIAKARALVRSDDEQVDSDERIFFPDQDLPEPLPRRSRERYMLERVRDEAHRFAITRHRSLRARKQHVSALDRIEGIGLKKRKALLKHFGSLKAVQQASIEALQSAPGIGPAMAKKIFEGLKSQHA